MSRETGDLRTVVHFPVVGFVEIRPNVAAHERCIGAHRFVAFGVEVEVMNAKQERVHRLTHEPHGAVGTNR